METRAQKLLEVIWSYREGGRGTGRGTGTGRIIGNGSQGYGS